MSVPDQIAELHSIIDRLKKDCDLKNKEIGRLKRNGGPACSLTTLETTFEYEFDFTDDNVKSIDSLEVELPVVTVVLTFGEYTHPRSGAVCHYLMPQIKTHEESRMTIITTTSVSASYDIYTEDTVFELVNASSGESVTLKAKKVLTKSYGDAIKKGKLKCVMKIFYDGSPTVLPYQQIDDMIVLRFKDLFVLQMLVAHMYRIAELNSPTAYQKIPLMTLQSTIQAHSGCLSMWSSYFAGYLCSEMKEAKEGVFPVEDYTAEEFRELLDVISPSSKLIDLFNLEKLLDMADRYLMPNLTNLCENFLTDRNRHNMTDIVIIKIADEYNLHTTRAIILERIKTSQEMKTKLSSNAQFTELSDTMKSAIGSRFVELMMAGK